MSFTVFLDRDGVFNHHPRIGVRRPKDLHMLPGAADAFARLRRDDVRTCLCTNQPLIGVGLLSRRRLARIHDRLQEELAAAGHRLDHIEAAGAPAPVPSRRRKPGPGMLEAGAAALGQQGWRVDKERAVMIGDKPKDAMAGNAYGIPAILLATTYSEAKLDRAVIENRLDAIVAQDLAEAVELIIGRLERHA